MAILARPKINPQQRYDLEDYNALLSALRTDSKLWTKQILSSENLVVKGFSVTGIGLNQATILMADATLIVPQNAFDFSYFISSPAEPNIIVPDADLQDGARNYLEIELQTEDNTPLTKAFWDPEANSGAGAEFNQIVDTVTDLKAVAVVSTGGFSGSVNRIPIAIIDTNGSGNIKMILDRRNMLGRLSRPSNLDYETTWGTKVEPVYQLTMTGVVGTFIAGEQLTIGSETAEVVTGGGASITFNEPTGINFSNGDSVTGGTSGATGTVDTVLESFIGVDKNLTNYKAVIDAIFTEIKLMKGTRFWWQDASVSINGVASFFDTVLVQEVLGAKFAWDGNNLSISDESVTPLNADVLANLRQFGKTGDLELTRQDGTGGSVVIPIADEEVMFIKLPGVGSRVYDGIGAGVTNYQVVTKNSYVSSDENYWIAYRENGLLYIRGYGELEAGEETPISDPDKETILALIQASTDRANQDRNIKVIEGGTWSLVEDGSDYELTLSLDAYLDVPGLTRSRNMISAQTITLPNANSVAYVEIERTPGVALVRPVTVADVNSISLDNNIVVIARRVVGGVLVGSHSFFLKPGELLELDGALQEINRLLTQLRIKEHPTTSSKAIISASDITQLNTDILSQVVGEFILSFTGAVINFTTGAILKEDDVTPLGINFTPFVIPVGEYYWYGISLIPEDVLPDNRQEAQVQIDFGDSANAVQASAPLPVITGDIKLGAIQVFNNAGVIEVVQIRRLGVGSGSGSGSGDASLLDTLLRDRFAVNSFELMDQNIFRRDKATKVDVSSTGAYNPAKRAFAWTSIGQTLVSQDVLDQSFLDEGVDITEAELYFTYLTGFVDSAATYEISRDGGTNWQTMTMSQVGLNGFRGYHVFSDEVSNQALQTVAATGAGQALNATTQQELSSQLVLSTTSVVKTLNLNMNYGGVGTGLVTLRLVKNNAGVPSTAVGDIISESDAKIISAASLGGTGDITVTFNIPDVCLVAGTYHIVLITDAAYKAGTLDLSWRNGAGTNGATYNGTAWTGAASTKAAVVSGRAHDLIVRVTSSVALSYAEGYGLYYGLTNGVTSATGEKRFQKIYFSGDDNETDFLLTFTPDPELLEILDPYRGQTYAIEEGVARIEGQTVKFEPNTFDFPGEDIVLIFRQTKGSVIDNSDSNAAAISEIQSNLIDIGDELASISDSMILPKIVVPFTTIQNRSKIPDLSQDLKPRFAIDRINIQQIVELQDEQGPNGETVFGVVNDKFNQIRFVGAWAQRNTITNYGQYIQTSISNTTDYMEVTFYGTGLNLLHIGIVGDHRASVDGGAEGSNLALASHSDVLGTRNYTANLLYKVVNGLALGIHTVKIRSNNQLTVCGLEILNENASGLIQLPPGAQLYKGKKRTHSILETTPYSSVFETGTLGTRGGRVLVYQKSDGSVAKAVTPTDASQLNLISANHANEEIARTYYWREFGAGRSDDFSTLVSAFSDRAFTLDDGTTTLVVNEGRTVGTAPELLNIGGVGNVITLTFVGTGLDVVWAKDGATINWDISVDGATIGTALQPNTTGFTNLETRRIVSGLPYGTHIVRFSGTAVNTNNIGIARFIVYQPKTPSIPINSVDICAYNIMANFSIGTITSGGNAADHLQVPVGTLRKYSNREFIFRNGTFTAVLSTLGVNSPSSGVILFTPTVSSVMEYNFYGTGAVLYLNRSSTNNNDYTVQIDGVLTSGTVLTTGSVTNLGGGSYRNLFSAPQDQGPARIQFSGLALGLHTVTITKTAGADNFIVSGIDIITPIHSPKNNGPFILQNTLSIGSQGISDLRKFSKKDIRTTNNISQALGVTSNPVTSLIVPIPMPEISVCHFSKTGRIKISYSSTIVMTSGSSDNSLTNVFVNGVQASSQTNQHHALNAGSMHSRELIINVSIGFNKIDVYWRGGGNAMTLLGTSRNLLVEDVE